MKSKIWILKSCLTGAVLLILFIFSASFTRERLQTRQEDKPVTLEEFNKRIANREKMVLVYFSADWCAVCLKMKPVLEKVQSQFSNKIEILKIDTDRDKEITNEFEIDALPVLILYRNGVREWIYVGVIDEKLLHAKIESYGI